MSKLNSGWRKMAEDHWKEHLPKLYSHLKKEGELDEALDYAVAQTPHEMIVTQNAGATRQEAWEELRERYLILPPESSPE